ncbi:MAG: right-handed parallel beta-helix repeat-containing protein, partial [Methanomassiliicoccaceae archaeon]|nr:right-handed parallel beta-helix repeat-containing protein [Methanomassiliicoccaceae archaeon]
GVDIYGDTSATITVNGGIDAGGYGIDVDDGTATIVVKGGIVSQGSGILVNSEATADITVKGGIDASNGFNGLEIYGTVTIEVTGDIKSGPASNGIYIPKGTADITVHGNIISGFEGIYIEDGATATITVNGEITPGVASCEVSFDGDAVEPKEAKTNGYTEYSGVGSDDEPWIVWVSGTTKVPASLVIKNPKTSYMLDGKFTLKGAVWLVYTNGMTEELKAGYVSSIVPGTVLDTKGVFSVTVTYECAFGVFTADDFDITVKGADVKSDSVIMLPVFAIFGGILGAVYFLANKKP